MIKIGIIGLGWMATGVHIPCLQRIEDVRIVSVCRRNALELSKISKKIKANPYTDYKEMLEKESLDGVYVSTPASSHKDIVIEALKRKINVFCEKPPALTLEGASLMTEEAKKNKRLLFFGFNRRFSPLYLKLKEISDKYGPNVLLIEKVKMPFEWKREAINLSGSQAVENGIHFTDLARWICGEIKEIYGKSRKIGSTTDCNNDIIALFLHKNGAKTLLILNYLAGENKERVVLHSNEISAEILFGKENKVKIVREDKVKDEEYKMPSNPLEAQGFLGETKCFIDCIKKEKDPFFTSEEGIKSLELAMKLDKL